MNAVTYLLIYAVALSWLAPTVLSRLASDGVSPRLAVTGWLTTVATALFAWGAALVILVVGAAHSLITHTALTFCVETLGITEAVEFPPVVATVLTGALLAVTAAVAVARHTAWSSRCSRCGAPIAGTQKRSASSADRPTTMTSSS